uniref:ATP synthase F0 subunit 8 n=1 Tax=Lampsilis siliquoidea TaxID=52396 RepID=A0A4Y1KRY8_LAMSI|nr:ATP synthase F0 subunit 8 [Lampsilis siliquoidea]
MPQLSPISWVLVSFFMLVMIVCIGVKVWWGNSVMVYNTAIPLGSDKVFNYRLFGWKS